MKKYHLLSLITAIAMAVACLSCQTGSSSQSKIVNADSLPDLIVSDFILTPSQPKLGEKVMLKAIVKNVGNSATKLGDTIGVGFYGSYHGNYAFCWGSVKDIVLKPGDSVVIEPDGGPTPNLFWRACDAAYLVARVDDVHRINESDELNNFCHWGFINPALALEKPLALENAPDLVITKFTWTPLFPILGDSIEYNVEVTNKGNQPTPKDLPIIINITDDLGGIQPVLAYSQVIVPGQTVTMKPDLTKGPAKWAMRKSGNGIAFLELDVENKIAETNETNNIWQKEVWVKNNSAPVANTDTLLPDLIITKVVMNPEIPMPGDKVNFSITIKNIGKAATPNGVTLGAGIGTNEHGGKGVLWADYYNKSLAPGDSITLTTNNGPEKSGFWKASIATGLITAVVDDVNRIKELNEGNNEVGYFPLFKTYGNEN